MSSLWSAGGSVDLASRALGLRYNIPETSDGHLFQLFGKVYADVALKSDTALQLPKSLGKNLESRCCQIEDNFHQVFLPTLQKELEHWNAVDFSKLQLKNQLELVETVTDYFANEAYAFAEQINIMASFLNQQAATECERQNLDMLKLMQAPMPHAPSQIMLRSADLPSDKRKHALLLEMGHRAVFDYEVSLPRYFENPEALWKLAQSNVSPINTHQTGSATYAQDINVPIVVDRALRFQDLKEHAKHESIRVLSVLRKALLVIDTHFGPQGYVFYLTYQELLRCDENNLENLTDLASHRFKISQSLKKFAPNKAALSLHECELFSNPMQQSSLHKGDFQGTYVSGNQDITGHIYLTSVEQEQGVADLKGFAPGDILACNMINPAWLPHILKSKAVICEVGGWLSHMAIVAREQNIPMIVGCTGIRNLKHGDKVKIFKTGDIERITKDGVSAGQKTRTKAL